jgi:hypothetical protein
VAASGITPTFPAISPLENRGNSYQQSMSEIDRLMLIIGEAEIVV